MAALFVHFSLQTPNGAPSANQRSVCDGESGGDCALHDAKRHHKRQSAEREAS